MRGDNYLNEETGTREWAKNERGDKVNKETRENE